MLLRKKFVAITRIKFQVNGDPGDQLKHSKAQLEFRRTGAISTPATVLQKFILELRSEREELLLFRLGHIDFAAQAEPPLAR